MEPDKKIRSGSETRQKQYRLVIRLSEDERAELVELAQKSGLTLASYARSHILANPTTRSTRAPRVEVQTLAKLHGQINKVGSNIAQLLKRVNFGETPHSLEVREAFTGCAATLAAIQTAVGRDPA